MMRPLDQEKFFGLMRARSGLKLDATKAYLLESRLASIAAAEKLADVSALVTRVVTEADERLIRKCVDALATHETYFFRDQTPFEQFRRALPDLIAARAHTRMLRVWSAACSSGQEAYSIALLLKGFQAQLADWRIEIVATDMSETILAKARVGRYSDFEVGRGLTPEQRDRWLRRVGDVWEVAPVLSEMVTFRRHNLMEGTGGLGVFDVVFCRNVLIYFESALKTKVLETIASATARDGLLFLGSAETVMGLTDRFETTAEGRSCFRRTAPATKLITA